MFVRFPFVSSYIFIPLSIVFWNVQGAASPEFRRSYASAVRSYKQALVVMLEPRSQMPLSSGFEKSHKS